MRGTTKKKIEKWATFTWNNTPDNQQCFKSIEHFVEQIKTDWQTNQDFKKFINEMIKKEDL